MPMVLSPPCVSIVNTSVAVYLSGSRVLIVGPVSVLALMFALAFVLAFGIFAFELALAFGFVAGWQAATGSNITSSKNILIVGLSSRTRISNIDHLKICDVRTSLGIDGLEGVVDRITRASSRLEIPKGA